MIRTFLLLLAMLVATGPLHAKEMTSPRPNMLIEDRTISEEPGWINDNKGAAKSVSRSVFRRDRVSCSKKCFVLYNSGDVLWEDVEVSQTRPLAIDQQPGGIVLEGGSNVTLRRVTIHGFDTTAEAGRYRQGDGLRAEHGLVGLRVEDSVFRDNRDGCIDSKAREVSLLRVRTERCGRNNRVWWSVWRIADHTSVDPSSAHFWIRSDPSADGKGIKAGGIIATGTLTIRSTTPAPVFYVEKPGGTVDLSAARCTFAVPAGTPLFKFASGASAKNTTVRLSASCQPDAKGLVAAAAPTPAAGFDAGELLADRDGDGVVELQTAATIARISKAAGVALKKGDRLRALGSTRYELVR